MTDMSARPTYVTRLQDADEKYKDRIRNRLTEAELASTRKIMYILSAVKLW